MVYRVYSLESPRWGDSNENTQYIFITDEDFEENRKDIPVKPPALAL